MLRRCKCCNARHAVCTQPILGVAYCDRCEVAYVQFKLRLLAALQRDGIRNADEV